MTPIRTHVRRSVAFAGGLAGVAALAYGAYVGTTWYRYGRQAEGARQPGDVLDPFMPLYEVSERHEVEVAAPAAVTYAAARAVDVNESPLARAIFRAREIPARISGARLERPHRSLVDETQALGWRILSEVPGRSLVMGAVTQPWLAEVRFRGLDSAEFEAFDEPAYAKIVWTLEVEPLGPERSRFITRTRVVTTDAESRVRFRRYWSFLSPGILLIRRSTLPLVRRSAERRYQEMRSAAAE